MFMVPALIIAQQASEAYRQFYEDQADPDGAPERARLRQERRLLLEQREHEIAVAKASAPRIINHYHDGDRFDSSPATGATGLALGVLLGESISEIARL